MPSRRELSRSACIADHRSRRSVWRVGCTARLRGMVLSKTRFTQNNTAGRAPTPNTSIVDDSLSHRRTQQTLLGRLGLSKWRLLLGVVLLGVLLRSLTFVSSPRFMAVGDAAEYVALARELALNQFTIPGHNTLYYPGTPWIYPPLGIELLALGVKLLGDAGWAPFYLLAALMVFFGALTVIPVYFLTEEVFGEDTALAAAIIFSSYPPDLYALSWGAYPQILATFVTAWILYLWVKTERRGGFMNNSLLMGLLVGVVALVHDLTIFVLFGVLLIYAVGGLFWALIRHRSLLESVKGAWVALAVSSPFVAYWYAPRLRWVIYAASSSSASQALVATVRQFLSSFAIPLGVYYGYMVVYVVFLLVSAWPIVRKFERPVLPLLVLATSPIVLMVYRHSDVTLLERLPYYTLLPATIFVARGLSFASERAEKAIGRIKPRRAWVAGLAIIMVFGCFTAFAAVSYSASSHTYYAQCDYCYGSTQPLTALSLYQWVEQNTPPGSVFAAAGHLGYYIAAYDGRPTIVYHPLDYLTQPSERYESLAAYTLVFSPATNIVETLTYIKQFNVSYVVLYDYYNVTVPYFYRPVYSGGGVTVYRIDLTEAGQT